MRLLLVAVVLLLASVLPAWGGPCTPVERFSLETDWYGGVTVPVHIGGKVVTLLVDTGGTNSMLTASTVQSLGLPTLPIRNMRVTLYGGLELTRYVNVPDVAVGRAGRMAMAFYVMPDNRIPYALSGTLAPDFLSRFDVSFEFASATMTLYEPGSCITDGVALMPDPNNHLIVPVNLDGRMIPAMLDTGASRSDLSLETANALFGFQPGRLVPAQRADAERGLYTHPFRFLTIGGATIEDPDLVLVPDAISRRPLGSPRLVLGMGVLRRLNLYISFARHRLMVSRTQ